MMQRHTVVHRLKVIVCTFLSAVGSIVLLFLIWFEILCPAYSMDLREIPLSESQIMQEMPEIIINDDEKALVRLVQKSEEYQEFSRKGIIHVTEYSFLEERANELCKQSPCGELYDKCEIYLYQSIPSAEYVDRGIEFRLFFHTSDICPREILRYEITEPLISKNIEEIDLNFQGEGCTWIKRIYEYTGTLPRGRIEGSRPIDTPDAEFIEYAYLNFEGEEKLMKFETEIKRYPFAWLPSV